MAASRILSVCSETILQTLRAAVLQSHGFIVSCAQSHAEAAEYISQNQADCILLGFTLSAEEQISLIRLVKHSLSRPPVLVMSRNSEVVRQANAGIDPLEGPAQLVAAVSELLAKPAARPKARAASAK